MRTLQTRRYQTRRCQTSLATQFLSQSWTIKELLAIGKNTLKEGEAASPPLAEKGETASHFVSPLLEAELLLLHALAKRDRLWLYKNHNLLLLSKKYKRNLKKYASLLQRRICLEPLAYILKEREFYGRLFQVKAGVLIPRPETEELLDHALKLSLPSEGKEIDTHVLDLGCGSGCIGLSFLLERPEICLHLSDISRAALRVCRHNKKKLLPTSFFFGKKKNPRRICIYRSDLFQKLPNCFYDLILCNPPYVFSDEYLSLPLDIRNYEPKEALVCPEPFIFYERLLNGIFNRLKPKGYALIESSPRAAVLCEKIARAYGFDTKLLPDLSGKIRFVLLKSCFM